MATSQAARSRLQPRKTERPKDLTNDWQPPHNSCRATVIGQPATRDRVENKDRWSGDVTGQNRILA